MSVGADADDDPEAAYYRTVEEYFVSRRGEPLFLSNADWHLVRKWKAAGLPLRVVLRGIRDALDAHAHSWSRDRPVKSLSYCAHEVEAARDRWERALTLRRDDGLDAESALRGFARDLEGARGLGPRATDAAAAIAGELRSRMEEGELGELTAWLAERERRLLQAIRSDMAEGELAAVEAEVGATLERYRERMPPRVLEQLRAESMARRMLESHGLPRLSLFHLEAPVGDAS